MGTYRVLIFLAPAEGREAEFHEWYEHTHLDEVLATAGFSNAQRFGLEISTGLDAPGGHLAVYDSEGDSAAEVLERLASTRDQRSYPDVMDASRSAIWVFTPLGELHRAE